MAKKKVDPLFEAMLWSDGSRARAQLTMVGWLRTFVEQKIKYWAIRNVEYGYDEGIGVRGLAIAAIRAEGMYYSVDEERTQRYMSFADDLEPLGIIRIEPFVMGGKTYPEYRMALPVKEGLENAERLVSGK